MRVFAAVSSRNVRAVVFLCGAAAALVASACGTKEVGETVPHSGGVSIDGGAFGTNQPVFPAGLTTAQDPPPPISGGTLIVLHDGATAAAADPDRDTVAVVALQPTPAVQFTVPLQSHDEPGRLVEDAAGRVHVALRRGGALVTIDPTQGTILARRSVCATPRGVAYDPATDLVHVACMDGQLVSLPAAGGAATRVVQLPRDLRDVVVDGDHLLVSVFRSAQVLTVDASGNVTQTEAPASYADPFTLSGATFTPSTAWRMRSAPGGGALLLHQRGSTAPVNVSKGMGGTTGSSGYGGPDPCQALVHPALTPVGGGQSAVDGGQSGSATPPIPGMVLPVDFALASDGSEIAVVAAGNAYTPGRSTLFISTVSALTDSSFHGCCGEGVHGPQPDNASVMQPGCGGSPPKPPCPQPNGEVVAVAFDGANRVVVQTREPATLQLPESGLIVNLSGESRADIGHAIFHANTGFGIACASCHGEGQDDGRIWTFDTEGPRRTMSVAGGISARAPYHWSGDLPNFDSLVATVYNGRMGGPTLAGGQETGMQAWMNDIPALPGVVTDAAAVARGQAIFNDPSHGCAICHNGAQLTDDRIVDVGTGGMFKVPSLVGLAWTSPYLHDGCAATLADRFGACGGGDLHGVTSTLSAGDQSDLIAYLDSL